jgi:SAM-dependent methyltransferase
MDFKTKCLLQWLFSAIPNGENLNYLLQSYAFKSIPISNELFLQKVGTMYGHYKRFCDHQSLEVNTHRYYEFGAGWELTEPITMGLLGYEVSCIDIRRLVKNRLLRDTITKIMHLSDQLPFPIASVDYEPSRNPLSFLREKYTFSYIAPADARKTPFASNYFDFASSSVTFEHIPVADISLILDETYRILKPGGVFTVLIDYQDHWSYFDQSITAYNYLRFSDDEWKKYNPSLHYQNRLRHRDYLDIIKSSSFRVVEDNPIYPSEDDIRVLKSMNLHEKFKDYTLDELGIRASQIVLKK